MNIKFKWGFFALSIILALIFSLVATPGVIPAQANAEFEHALYTPALPGIPITTIPYTYTQSFDNPPTDMPRSGTVNWVDNVTVPGWSVVRTGSGTSIVASMGNESAGNLYSYGNGNSDKRSLGSIGNSTTGGFYWGVCFVNQTGYPLDRFIIQYYGEQWYKSGAAAQTVSFHYQVADHCQPLDAIGGWVPHPALNYTSPLFGGTAGRVNGNDNSAAISSEIELLVSAGKALTLRWYDPDHPGADHGLAINNFSLTTYANRSPIAYDQQVSTNEDTPLEIVLQASDPDGDPLTWIVDNPQNGQLSGTAPNLTYTPAENWHGQDSFTFQVYDGDYFSNTASVTITVLSVLDPPVINSADITGPYAAGTPQAFHVSLENPAYGDEFSQVLILFRIENATLGDITTFEYFDDLSDRWYPMPLTQVGDDLTGYYGPQTGFPLSAPYTAESSFRINFNTPGNYAFRINLVDLAADPVETLTAFNDQAIVLPALTLDAITLQESSDGNEWKPVNGSLAEGWKMALDTSIDWYFLNSSDLASNRPLKAGYYAFYVQTFPADYFTYWAGRGVIEEAEQAWQQVMWEIINGREPIFFLKVSETEPKLQLVDGFLKLLGQEDDYLRIDGSYLPGAYTFMGEVEDQSGFTASAVVRITFNDVPVAKAQSLQTFRNQALEIILSGSDLFGEALEFKHELPSHGELTGTPPNLTYTPDPGFVGQDSFVFRVEDGELTSLSATVTIDVINRAPELGDNQFAIQQDQILESSLVVIDPDGDELVITLVTSPSHGSLDLQPDGSFTFIPDAGYYGIDSFSFTVDDGIAEVQGDAIITVSQLVNADLAVGLTAAPNPVTAGDVLTYQVQITNHGPMPAVNVTLTLTLPNSAVFATASGQGWTCQHNLGVVTCNRGSLAVGLAPLITVVVTAPENAGAIHTSTQVSSTTPDLSPTNNQASASTLVVSLPVTGGHTVFLPFVIK